MKLRDGRDVATDIVISGGRYNLYDCPGTGMEPRVDYSGDAAHILHGEVQHSLLSLDLDEGVTPAFITCPDHGKTSGSRFYRVPSPEQHLPVRMVWRRATKSELKRERRDGGDHFARGGLAREWVL